MSEKKDNSNAIFKGNDTNNLPPCVSFSQDYTSIIQTLIDLTLICRPDDVISFSARFFKDQKNENSTVFHSCHVLPFLLSNEIEFKSHCCTLFCYYYENFSRDLVIENKVLSNFNSSLKNYICKSSIRSIYQNMKSDFFQSFEFIDELISSDSNIIYNKQNEIRSINTNNSNINEIEENSIINFEALVFYLRLIILCNFVVKWTHVQIYKFIQPKQDNNIEPHPNAKPICYKIESLDDFKLHLSIESNTIYCKNQFNSKVSPCPWSIHEHNKWLSILKEIINNMLLNDLNNGCDSNDLCKEVVIEYIKKYEI